MKLAFLLLSGKTLQFIGGLTVVFVIFVIAYLIACFSLGVFGNRKRRRTP